MIPATSAFVAYISWNALFAEGCGGCGEEIPLDDWELGECGPFNIECCVPPEDSKPATPADEDEEEDAVADSQHDPDLPLSPTLQDTSSGFQGAQDLADYGWLGGSNGRPQARWRRAGWRR